MADLGRQIDLTPLDKLKQHRADAKHGGDDLVFQTSTGRQRARHNVRSRILLPTRDGITNHTCRRTFASMLYEAGASPAYVMAQMGHESAALALEVYSKVMNRKRDTGARMDALIRGADWARTGTNGDHDASVLPVEETNRAAIPLPKPLS